MSNYFGVLRVAEMTAYIEVKTQTFYYRDLAVLPKLASSDPPVCWDYRYAPTSRLCSLQVIEDFADFIVG
jgi:hypothetical protein